MLTAIPAIILLLLCACGLSSGREQTKQSEQPEHEMKTSYTEDHSWNGVIPEEPEYIPEEYRRPSVHPGTLEKLTYQTWESFSYESHEQPLTKEAWVYLPYGYDAGERYNVFYLSHGGWSNETTLMGTDKRPTSFKYAIDHAIEDGLIQPLLIVLPTYNNTSPEDSGDYSLAIRLTENFHNELINDLIPAVETKYSTYAKDVTPEGLEDSRDHRGFGGFSMGSVNTWRTFEYCLDYFRYFMPMSGNTSLYGDELADAVNRAGRSWDEFFIFTASGTSDFAYSAFKRQVMNMAAREDGIFRLADSEAKGNLSFREREGYAHDSVAADEYTYNGLRFFWSGDDTAAAKSGAYTTETRMEDVTHDPIFGDYGRLIFPVDAGYHSGETLGELRMTWYNFIRPEKTVEIVNYMRDRAASGETIFYPIYSEAEMEADPTKRDTGLFYFRGEPGAKYAIVNAGGGFVYVGAMHDSFPQALELSKMGYNAFALIYRPDDPYNDLAQAIAYITNHAEELDVDPEGYSLWGGSAGARMAATLGNRAVLHEALGDGAPEAAAVIMQYTGYSAVSESDAPTYVCVGTSDGIANWRTMQRRLEALDALGIPTEFHAYDGLPHGFGLGTGTAAEGWIEDAVAFWEKNQ